MSGSHPAYDFFDLVEGVLLLLLRVLQELLDQHGALPAFIGGSSSGARVSILLGLRHAEAVRGLLLLRVTGGEFAARRRWGAELLLELSALCLGDERGGARFGRPPAHPPPPPFLPTSLDGSKV